MQTNDQTLSLDDAHSPIQGIIQQAYPPHPGRSLHAIRVVLGKDVVTASECAEFEKIVSVSATGVKFWYWYYPERGESGVLYTKLNGLFELMKVVVWPGVIGQGCERRFLQNPKVTRTESVAIQSYEEAVRRGSELLFRDMHSSLANEPSLQELLRAVENSDVDRLKRFADDVPEKIAEVGRESIQAFIEAIIAGEKDSRDFQLRSLLFRILDVNRASRLTSGLYVDWKSAELSEAIRLIAVQLRDLIKLARKRYAIEFKEFCLSEEMRQYANRNFPGASSCSGEHSYASSIDVFVTTYLESLE